MSEPRIQRIDWPWIVSAIGLIALYWAEARDLPFAAVVGIVAVMSWGAFNSRE